MADRRNGRWIWVGVAGTGVALVVAVVGLLGIPNCAELQTKIEAKEAHVGIEEDLRRDLNATVELNAAQHETMGEAIKTNQAEVKGNQKEIRWMFKKLIGEMREAHE